jgi:hypothetical protein
VLGEPRAQASLRRVEPRVHRELRHALRRCDLAHVEVLERVQHEGLALLERQRRQRRVEILDQALVVERRLRRDERRDAERGLRMWTFATYVGAVPVVARHAQADAIHPRAR